MPPATTEYGGGAGSAPTTSPANRSRRTTVHVRCAGQPNYAACSRNHARADQLAGSGSTRDIRGMRESFVVSTVASTLIRLVRRSKRQWTVKPSAKPTQVRTLDLPPPAKWVLSWEEWTQGPVPSYAVGCGCRSAHQIAGRCRIPYRPRRDRITEPALVLVKGHGGNSVLGNVTQEAKNLQALRTSRVNLVLPRCSRLID